MVTYKTTKVSYGTKPKPKGKRVYYKKTTIDYKPKETEKKGILNERGKKVFGFIKTKATQASNSIKKYQAEAPQRRAAEIKRLKQEAAIIRQKTQLRKLREQAAPRTNFGAMGGSSFGLGGGDITGGMFSSPAPSTPKPKPKLRKRRRKTTKRKKKAMIVYV